MGYALYHNGNPISPKFRNWWPTKARGEARIRNIKAEKRASKKRAKAKPKKKKRKSFADRLKAF